MEFLVSSSPNILFNYISTPSGLLEWFADNVNVKGKIYKFIWEGEETPAELIRKVQGNQSAFISWIPPMRSTWKWRSVKMN